MSAYIVLPCVFVLVIATLREIGRFRQTGIGWRRGLPVYIKTRSIVQTPPVGVSFETLVNMTNQELAA